MPNDFAKNIKDKFFQPWLLLLLVAFVLFLPASNIKFSWVDDGWDIQMCQTFISYAKNLDFGNFFGQFFETTNGRFRPVYWLWLIFSYLIGDNNPAIHYFLRFLIIFGASYFIYKIVFLSTKSKIAGIFSAVFYLVSPINIENWYRLGPQEPLIGLFSTISIYFLLKGNNKWLPVIYFVLAFFSKESACALLIPIVFIYFGKRLILKKRDRVMEKYLMVGFILLVLLMSITTITRSGYSQNYVYNFMDILKRFLIYLKISIKSFEPFVVILTTSFLLRMFFGVRKFNLKKIDEALLWQTFFEIWFLSFFIIQAPWVYVLTRYMLPATIGLFIFMGLELRQISKILNKNDNYKHLAIIFIFFLISFFALNLFNAFNYGRKSVYGTSQVQTMTSLIAENVPLNGNVYLNFLKGEGTIELVIETKMHLELFYNRPDISVNYFDINNPPLRPYYLISGTSAPLGFEEETIEKVLNTKPLKEMKSEEIIPLFATPSNMTKQVLEKGRRFLVNGEKFDFSSFYTPINLKDYWRIYYAKL